MALLRQKHRVLGTFDLLTKTPFTFVRSMGAGVHDFPWQPIEGALATNDEAGAFFGFGLASGVARGTSSLVSQTIDGSLGVVSPVTVGLGGTVAALSMNQAYTTRRAINRAAEHASGRNISAAALVHVARAAFM